MVEDAAGVEDSSGEGMEVEGESKERGWEHGPGGAISVAIPLPPPALLSITLHRHPFSDPFFVALLVVLDNTALFLSML